MSLLLTPMESHIEASSQKYWGYFGSQVGPQKKLKKTKQTLDLKPKWVPESLLLLVVEYYHIPGLSGHRIIQSTFSPLLVYRIIVVIPIVFHADVVAVGLGGL